MKCPQILLLISILLPFYSFAQQKQVTTEEMQFTIEDVNNAIDGEDTGNFSSFNNAIKGMKERSLPIIQNIIFDNFIDEDDVRPIDARSLKIETIYPDLYQEESRYRALDTYRVTLSQDFHTIVVTYQLGHDKVESTLINYDLKGNIIDYQIIAYHECSQNLNKITSRISEHGITTHHHSFGLTKELEVQHYMVNIDGNLDKTDSNRLSDTLENFALISSILKELDLELLNVKTNLIVSKPNPQTLNEVIVVIPEIVDEGEHYFELNSHILIADNRSREITHKYFESSQTNQWVSDAIELNEISIDTGRYYISEDTRAFGVRVHYIGMSRVNPSEKETLSLFLKSGDGLKKILDQYPTKNFSGEWNGSCSGKFENIENTLIISDKKTNVFSNILIRSKIIKTTTEENENAECIDIVTQTTQNSLLKFNGKEYKPVNIQ